MAVSEAVDKAIDGIPLESGMSDETTYHVWVGSRQKGSNLLFLLYLAQQADDWGYCFPSVPRIAERIRMSERAVQLIKQKLLSNVQRKGQGELRVVSTAGPRSPDILQVICGLSESEIRDSESRSPIAQAIKSGKSFDEIYAAGKISRGAKIAPLKTRGAISSPQSRRGEEFSPQEKTLKKRAFPSGGEKFAPNIKSVVALNNKQQAPAELQNASLSKLTKRDEKELHAILEGVGFQGKIPDFIFNAMKNNKRMIRSWYYSVIRLEGGDRKYMGGRFRTGVESGRMAPGWKDLVVHQNKQVMRCEVPVGEDK